MDGGCAARDEFTAGTPRVLFHHPFQAGSGNGFDVFPDGERFVMILADEEADRTERRLVVVLNWFEELERLVPTN